MDITQYIEFRISQLEAELLTIPKQYVNDILEIAARIDELKKLLNETLMTYKIVVWKDGSYLLVKDGITWEYENDEDYLTTIPII